MQEVPRQWTNAPYNFDHLGMALISLFVTVTLNGYMGEGPKVKLAHVCVCVWGAGGRGVGGQRCRGCLSYCYSRLRCCCKGCMTAA